MVVGDFIDNLEDFVYKKTSDIEDFEVAMIAISKELSARYLTTKSDNKDAVNNKEIICQMN